MKDRFFKVSIHALVDTFDNLCTASDQYINGQYINAPV